MGDEDRHLIGEVAADGEVAVAGQDVVDRIKRGDGPNGEVSDPDWMAKVTVKPE